MFVCTCQTNTKRTSTDTMTSPDVKRRTRFCLCAAAEQALGGLVQPRSAHLLLLVTSVGLLATWPESPDQALVASLQMPKPISQGQSPVKSHLLHAWKNKQIFKYRVLQRTGMSIAEAGLLSRQQTMFILLRCNNEN